MTKYQSNLKDRRICRQGTYTQKELDDLAKTVVYGGMATHKLHPGDYGFDPPVAPRPSKDVCDDIRTVLKGEAVRLFREGLRREMVSAFAVGSNPKYVWAVDAQGEVYEAKTKPGQETVYHGYRLSDDDSDQRDLIRKEWKKRCPKT